MLEWVCLGQWRRCWSVPSCAVGEERLLRLIRYLHVLYGLVKALLSLLLLLRIRILLVVLHWLLLRVLYWLCQVQEWVVGIRRRSYLCKRPIIRLL